MTSYLGLVYSEAAEIYAFFVGVTKDEIAEFAENCAIGATKVEVKKIWEAANDGEDYMANMNHVSNLVTKLNKGEMATEELPDLLNVA